MNWEKIGITFRKMSGIVGWITLGVISTVVIGQYQGVIEVNLSEDSKSLKVDGRACLVGKAYGKQH